jgi:hypothetical protein
LRAPTVAILCVLAGCRKPAPAEEQKKPRVEVTIRLDPKAAAANDEIPVRTGAPPDARQMFERSGIHLAVVGVPPDGDVAAFLGQAIPEAEAAGSNATVLVTTRCLKELQPPLEKGLLPYWSVALVVGARCEGGVNPRLGAMALVEAGSASRVRITFDQHTKVFLKVEALP